MGCFGGGMVLDVFGELDVRGSGGFETFWGSGRWREFEPKGSDKTACLAAYRFAAGM